MSALKAKEGVVIDQKGNPIADHRVGPVLNKFYQGFSENWMTVATITILLPLFLFAGIALISVAALAFTALWSTTRSKRRGSA